MTFAVDLTFFSAKEGRQVSGLTITPQSLDRLPSPFYERTLKKEVAPLGRNTPIPLMSAIQLTMEDLALFQAAQIKSLDMWLQQTFDTVIQEVCFEKQYLEYLQNKSWALIEAAIKAGMEAKSREVGYRVKQIFSEPELKENKFGELRLHGFPIIGLPLKSTSPACFDLNVAAQFFINSWDDAMIAEKINQGIDIESDILSELRNSLAAVLARITPNDFILKFSSDDDEGVSIEKRLIHAATNALINAYNAHVTFVVVTQVDTAEINRVRQILNEPQDVEFIATPYGRGEDIRFALSWKISDIDTDSWEIINKPFCNLDFIQTQVRSALSGAFSTRTYQDLRYVSEQSRINLEQAAQQAAAKHISAYFGLKISVSNLRREATVIEHEAEKLRSKIIIEEIADVNERLSHESEGRRIHRQQELDAIKKSGELTDRRHSRLIELLENPDRNKAEDDELAALQRTAGPTRDNVNSLPVGAQRRIAVVDTSSATNPERYSEQFFPKE